MYTVAKKKEKKLDPKAKVRNRGDVVVPAERAKDKKDHFPVNNKGQAANAISRVNQYSKAPDWYKGSLQSLIDAVYRKVHSKYPSIKIDKKKKKPGKQGYLEYALKNFIKCAELYSQTLGTDIDDTIYASASEETTNEPEDSGFDYKSKLVETVSKMTK